MMFLSVAAMLLASPGALLSSGELPVIGPALSADEMKCTGRPGAGPEMLQWVVVLDDEVIEVSPEELDPDDYGKARPTDYRCVRMLEMARSALWHSRERRSRLRAYPGGQ